MMNVKGYFTAFYAESFIKNTTKERGCIIIVSDFDKIARALETDIRNIFRKSRGVELRLS